MGLTHTLCALCTVLAGCRAGYSVDFVLNNESGSRIYIWFGYRAYG